MKTVQLVEWKRNENTSHIFLSNFNGDKLVLKPFFIEVFQTCLDQLKTNSIGSFVDLWTKACDNECNKLSMFIASKIDHDKSGAWKDAVVKVKTKFRGNLGEILVEMLAENGLLDFIKPGTYTPVDPGKEEFFDATAKRNGLPIGIQVKNYSKHNKVDQEVFWKAACQSDLWLRRDKLISDDDLKEFTSTPCQYIVSTSDPAAEILEERFKNSVVFLGPKWLDAKRIQGSSRTGESAKWKMFKEVIDEIDSFTP